MRKLLYSIMIGVALSTTGCASARHAYSKNDVREDITDFTSKDSYQETAKDFLRDDVLLPKSQNNMDIKAYCKDLSGQDSQLRQARMFDTVKTLQKFGVSGLEGTVEKPKLDFKRVYNFCNNFSSFITSLSPDERRKLLIFLGDDYFSVSWMQNRNQSVDKSSKMVVSHKTRQMVRDTGFDGALPDKSGYRKQRLFWQARNAGIAMLGFFQAVGKDKELGPVNPATMEELHSRYLLYRTTGFAWAEGMQQEDIQQSKLEYGDYQWKLGSLGYGLVGGKNRDIKATNVWGATELVESKTDTNKLHRVLETFPPSVELKTFYKELSKTKPDLVKVREASVGKVSDPTLDSIKRYAQWLADGKPKQGKNQNSAGENVRVPDGAVGDGTNEE